MGHSALKIIIGARPRDPLIILRGHFENRLQTEAETSTKRKVFIDGFIGGLMEFVLYMIELPKRKCGVSQECKRIWGGIWGEDPRSHPIKSI